MGMAKLRVLCAAVALLCAAPPGHPGAVLPAGEGDGYGVKLCGREFIRAVIFTCGGSRWKRLSLLAVEPAPAAGECPGSGAEGQAAVGALRSLPSDGPPGGMGRTGGNREGQAPRGASRSSHPEPRREGSCPSFAFPLHPSWHFRDFCKDALRLKGKGTVGAGALFAGIVCKVFGQFGATARLRGAAGCRGASTTKSHKNHTRPLWPCGEDAPWEAVGNACRYGFFGFSPFPIIPRAAERSGIPAGVSLPDGSPGAALPVRAPGNRGRHCHPLVLLCIRVGTLEDGLCCFRLRLTQQELLYGETVNSTQTASDKLLGSFNLQSVLDPEAEQLQRSSPFLGWETFKDLYSLNYYNEYVPVAGDLKKLVQQVEEATQKDREGTGNANPMESSSYLWARYPRRKRESLGLAGMCCKWGCTKAEISTICRV
ncbi:hypothetical protein Nmel_008134 [Mimus melanotis]